MLESLNQIDQAVFFFINASLQNPVTDFIMPVVTNDWVLRALYALPILDQFLHSVTALDAPMLALTALTILATVILGGYSPIHRISRIDPTHVLR